MFQSKQFDDLAKKLFSALPAGVKNIQSEIEQQFKEILQTAFNKLDLVTREEFDVQAKVLARTREKVEALQAQLESLIEAKK